MSDYPSVCFDRLHDAHMTNTHSTVYRNMSHAAFCSLCHFLMRLPAGGLATRWQTATVKLQLLFVNIDSRA